MGEWKVAMANEISAEARKLAAIAYGEASTLNDAEEIGAIAFAVANRARAWGGKSVDELLEADRNYTYAATDGNVRYNKVMSASETDLNTDVSMRIAVEWAIKALSGQGPDPSNGAFWWDGVDIKTNYSGHPKVKLGFRFGDSSHNIFGIKESIHEVIVHWKAVDKKTGKVVQLKERGRYKSVYVSSAAHGKTIFWSYDPDFVKVTGAKEYK